MAMSIFFLQQQVARKRGRGQGLKHLQQLAQILHEEEKDVRPNPVTQNVKIIMVCKIRFYMNWSSISSMKCISLKFICSLGLLMFSQIYFQHHLKYFKFFIPLLQSAGLLMVHFHSRFLANKKTMDMMGNDVASTQYREPDVSLWYFYIQRYSLIKPLINFYFHTCIDYCKFLITVNMN